jgi:hypothetical protein
MKHVARTAPWSSRSPDLADGRGSVPAPGLLTRASRVRSSIASHDRPDSAASLLHWLHPTCRPLPRPGSARVSTPPGWPAPVRGQSSAGPARPSSFCYSCASSHTSICCCESRWPYSISDAYLPEDATPDEGRERTSLRRSSSRQPSHGSAGSLSRRSPSWDSPSWDSPSWDSCCSSPSSWQQRRIVQALREAKRRHTSGPGRNHCPTIFVFSRDASPSCGCGSSGITRFRGRIPPQHQNRTSALTAAGIMRLQADRPKLLLTQTKSSGWRSSTTVQLQSKTQQKLAL